MLNRTKKQNSLSDTIACSYVLTSRLLTMATSNIWRLKQEAVMRIVKCK